MRLYEHSFMVDILEAKLLETFEDYNTQGTYNNIFLQYLYKYIKLNTYSGEHDVLLRTLNSLRSEPGFGDTSFEEKPDKKTYVITDSTGITKAMREKIKKITNKYPNCQYNIISNNRIEFEVSFGYLPPNTVSWLNLLNEDCLFDYYIDGVTLRPNTYTKSSERPDSGYVCYKIDETKEYDTIMFITNISKISQQNSIKPNDNELDFKVATILKEVSSPFDYIVNRSVNFGSISVDKEISIDNFFYEMGPFSQNYLTAEESSLIIQVPYDYVINDSYYVFDVSNSVQISEEDKSKTNDLDTYYASFSTEKEKFYKFSININKISDLPNIIISNKDSLDTTTQQYILGDFIWKTSDSKLIAYTQNLMKRLTQTNDLVSDGIWSDELSKYIENYKSENIIDNNTYSFIDDVLDKSTENIFINKFKLMYNTEDPNEVLFNDW